MRRTSIACLVFALVLGGVVGESGPARGGCAATDYVETLDVTAKARRHSYSIGQTAVVDLFVTDSITGMPASDVDTGIVIEGRGKKSPFATAPTGDEGHVVLRLSLKRSHVEPGWARALAVAWESVDTPAYCTGRYGSRDYPRLFRIRG